MFYRYLLLYLHKSSYLELQIDHFQFLDIHRKQIVIRFRYSVPKNIYEHLAELALMVSVNFTFHFSIFLIYLVYTQ